jgi:C1A family cysteine protease
MKNLFLILTILMLVSSCATSLKQQTDSAPPKAGATGSAFLSKSAVFALIKANSSKGSQIKSEPFSEKELSRASHLIPLDELFPAAKMKALNLKFKQHKAMKIMESGESDLYTPRGEVDLRDHDTPVKDQDNSKCTAFAGTAAIESTIGDKNVLSSWDSWSKYGVYSCESFMTALSLPANKICDETYYQQYGTRTANCSKTAHAYISDSLYIANDEKEIVRALNEHHVVYFGMSTPNDALKCLPYVDPKHGFANGGHALAFIGYYTYPELPGEVIAIVRNSWSENCSDHGYFYMPLSIIKKSGAYFGAWEIKKVSSVVDPTVVPSPVRKCLKWKKRFLSSKYKCVLWK